MKVYSVGMYSTPKIKQSISSMPKSEPSRALAALTRNLLHSSSSSSDPIAASLVLKLNFKVGAEKMANAIAESVLPRAINDDCNNNTNNNANSAAAVERLKQLIIEGVSSREGGVASPGTVIQFDCHGNDNGGGGGGIHVSVDGRRIGSAPKSLCGPFLNVFLDDESVSPALRESCVDNCCGKVDVGVGMTAGAGAGAGVTQQSSSSSASPAHNSMLAWLFHHKKNVVKLPNLPYAYNALNPVISEKTLKAHHLKHHAK